ncbi:sodium- and chloride-dependent neutral and basic amino acid transporter B(0+) [Rhipicephalus microplus]|uniref:sodium- and chloride-dependent neutral and basic amino acid transporter B(0+) n=1 Tax=Rhipicephalus microplus TaxID=6941 RepID=UPI003F6BC660
MHESKRSAHMMHRSVLPRISRLRFVTPVSQEYSPKNYASRAHKLATLFIMTAGSANATQFPMMFIVNGGLPFLLAYLAFLAVVTLPIMRLESGLAQFAGVGHFGVFSTVPLFIGVGVTMGVYAIVHIVADSVPVTDQLLYLLDSVREAAGNECRNGMLLAPNRSCFVPRHPFSLCRITRARLAESFRRRPLTQGMPVMDASDEVAHLTLVPPEVYHQHMASCLPGVYNYLQPYQLRRHGNWFEESSSALSEIRGQRLLSLAAIWMVVFALAHQGFNRVKWFVYVMVCIHVTTTLLLLVRAATLPGAMSGLGTMLYTDWSYAVNMKVWD